MTRSVPPLGQRIAVIGAGIAGLTAAYRLSGQHDVTLIEAADYLGGHTHTHDIVINHARLRVDTGFIVYNERTYPNFIALLDELGCRGRATGMSFSVRDDERDFEYNGHNLDTLFAQRRRLFDVSFHRLIADILRFNRRLGAVAANDDRTLGEFLRDERLGTLLRDRYVVPMAAAIWSTGTANINAFPIRALAAFFINHGLASVRHRPRWFVVEGGSAAYVDAMRPRLGRIVQGEAVTSITRRAHEVRVSTRYRTDSFDQVIIAAHSDQALAMLSDPTPAEREILGAIRYTVNDACLHTDERLLPRTRRAQASWNYRIEPRQTDRAMLTYNMNLLQGLDMETPVLVTLNDTGHIDESKVIRRMQYTHPLFDAGALAAQQRKGEISGKHRTWYAGAYWGYGFHEDGVVSALDVCRELEVPVRCSRVFIRARSGTNDSRRANMHSATASLTCSSISTNSMTSIGCRRFSRSTGPTSRVSGAAITCRRRGPSRKRSSGR